MNIRKKVSKILTECKNMRDVKEISIHRDIPDFTPNRPILYISHGEGSYMYKTLFCTFDEANQIAEDLKKELLNR